MTIHRLKLNTIDPWCEENKGFELYAWALDTYCPHGLGGGWELFYLLDTFNMEFLRLIRAHDKTTDQHDLGYRVDLPGGLVHRGAQKHDARRCGVEWSGHGGRRWRGGRLPY